MNNLWAVYILEAERVLYSEGIGPSLPVDLADEVVATELELARNEYTHVPSIQEALKRRTIIK